MLATDSTTTRPDEAKLVMARDLVAGWIDTPTGGLQSRTRIIDRLLDLRSLVSTDRDLVKAIDRRLVAVPGVTVVKSEWWNAEVRLLADLLLGSPGSG